MLPLSQVREMMLEMSSIHLKRAFGTGKNALRTGRRGSVQLHPPDQAPSGPRLTSHGAALKYRGPLAAKPQTATGVLRVGDKSVSPSARPETVTKPKVLWRNKELEKDPDHRKAPD